jgi:mono/diheme cytochrome c family protein
MRARRILAVVVPACFLCGALAAAGQAPGAPRRGGNPEAAKRVNPVPSSPESVAAGRRSYSQYCANCHGSTGRGDGSGGATGAPPADLTDAVWDYGSTDGEIFGVIHDGTSNEMGSYAERLKDADIWNIVNYIRTLALKK